MHQSQVNIENKFKVKLRYVPAKNLFIIIGQQSECDAALQEIHLNMETLQGLKVGEEHVPLPGAPNTKLLRYLATQRAVFNKIELQCSIQIVEITDRHIKYSVKEKDKQQAKKAIED